jgi:succinate dehydrogenase/fumarate reductase flavoprotein subunit
VGVCRDPEGKPVGKYVTKPDRNYGDIIIEVDKQIFARYAQSGSGPVYMDCRGISDEDLAYMLRGLEDEGNLGLLQHLREEGIDLRKHQIEFATYELRNLGFIRINERSETNIHGVFAAGDESMLSISGAAVFGWIGGENAATLAKGIGSVSMEVAEADIEEKMGNIEAIQKRTHGPDWKEANIALQHTLADYAGLVRSESLLDAGLAHLRRLKGKVHRMIRANNRWELVRCLEVINLYDLGEAIFVAALERKESRGLHLRVDYPYTDPLLNDKTLIVKKVGGEPVAEWKDAAR